MRGSLPGLIAVMVVANGAPALSPVYEVGQVWRYHSRPDDPSSLLRISGIDSAPMSSSFGVVYHITVIGVHLGGSSRTSIIDELPVSRQTLDASVTERTETPVSFPSNEKEIAEWRATHGGVLTIPVDQIVKIADDNVRRSASNAGGGP